MRLAPLLVGLALLAVPVAALPMGLSGPSAQELAEARAAALLNGQTLAGRTAQGWLDWAEARFDEPAAAGAQVPLGEAMRALYGAAGAEATVEQLATLDAAIAALDPAWARALGPLVASLAEGYAEQVLVAAMVDPAVFVARNGAALPPEGTALAAANAERVLGAIAAFRAQAAALGPAEGFADPLGLVVVGTAGDDTFTRGPTNNDPVLLLDNGGDDLDLTGSGAACAAPAGASECNGRALSVRVDLAGDDTYRYAGAHAVAQGSGAFGGLGILVDAAGRDVYDSTQLVSHGPFVTYYINGVMQGGGEAGAGLLLDLAGDDTYRFYGYSNTRELFGMGQGFAGLGGLGALLDADGHDVYDAYVLCEGPGNQFCGLYVQSTALYPGVSIQVDQGAGNDVYHGILYAPQEDYYSQSFAAFGAFALLVDGGGDDDYLDRAVTTRNTGGVSLNCAYGTAEYAGALAIFIDRDGNDKYLTETISTNSPYSMAEGFSLASASLFWDVRGDDWHEIRSIGPNPVVVGRGIGGNALENSAVYLDTGGDDVYADHIGDNNSIWGPQQGALGLGIDNNGL